MKANIHFVGGEKGGVGKSVTARVLAQYMIDKQIPFLGFDTDRSHGSLLRFYSDFASPVIVDRLENLDVIFESAAADANLRVLVDLAAQSHEPLVKWIDESGVLEIIDEIGLKICYWHVMDSGKDSVDLLGKLLDRFGSRFNYVIVLNELRGDNFNSFESTGMKERALGLGADIFTLKRLNEAVINKIDHASSSFWSAKNKDENTTHNLGILQRQRVKLWLNNAYTELDKLGL